MNHIDIFSGSVFSMLQQDNEKSEAMRQHILKRYAEILLASNGNEQAKSRVLSNKSRYAAMGSVKFCSIVTYVLNTDVGKYTLNNRGMFMSRELNSVLDIIDFGDKMSLQFNIINALNSLNVSAASNFGKQELGLIAAPIDDIEFSEVEADKGQEESVDFVFDELDEDDLKDGNTGNDNVEEADTENYEDITEDDIDKSIEDEIETEGESDNPEDTIEHTDEAESSAKKSIHDNKIVEYFRPTINSKVTNMLSAFGCLFESGYEINKPYGILTKRGVLRLAGNELKQPKPSIIMRALYKNIENAGLRLNEIEERQFSARAIINAPEDSVITFPYKLLEYAYGRENSVRAKSLSSYTPHSSNSTWEGYRESAIVPALTGLLEECIVALARTNGYTEENIEDLYNDLDALDTFTESVNAVCKKFENSVANCICIQTYKEDRNGNVVELKIRIYDAYNKLGENRDFFGKLIQSMRSKIGVQNNADDMIVNKSEQGEDGRYKFHEYSYIFDEKIANAEPLFAFKALDALTAKGITPSWDNIILGMSEEDRVLRAGKGQKINLGQKLTHRILAGSRSGKGVMTLNILASAIASKRPIFYIDRKPDMSSTMKYITNGRMFTVNGADHQQDDLRQQFTNDKMAGWNRNIPAYLEANLSWGTSSYEGNPYCDIFYYRGMMLTLGILAARAKGFTAELGGSGVVIIYDEVSNLLAGTFTNEITSNGKIGSKYSKKYNDIKQAVMDKVANGKTVPESDKPNEYELWCQEFMKSYISSLETWGSLERAGLNAEKNNSDIIVIGQSLGDASYDLSSGWGFNYKADGTMSNDAAGKGKQLSAFLYAADGDGFVGFNQNTGCSKYSGVTVSGTKASKLLTQEARRFAYIEDFKKETIVSGEDIDSQLTFFKPFLIFNESEPVGVGEEPQITYLVQSKNHIAIDCGLGDDGWANIVKNNEDINNPNHLDMRTGFKDYLASFMGENELLANMGLSGTIAQTVVEKLGYKGTWQEFICDLRPEWIFGIQDVADAFDKGLKLQDTISKRLPSISKFMPEMVGGAANLATGDGEENGEADPFKGITSEKYEEEANGESNNSSDEHVITDNSNTERVSDNLDISMGSGGIDDILLGDDIDNLGEVIEDTPEYEPGFEPEGYTDGMGVKSSTDFTSEDIDILDEYKEIHDSSNIDLNNIDDNVLDRAGVSENTLNNLENLRNAQNSGVDPDIMRQSVEDVRDDIIVSAEQAANIGNISEEELDNLKRVMEVRSEQKPDIRGLGVDRKKVVYDLNTVNTRNWDLARKENSIPCSKAFGGMSDRLNSLLYKTPSGQRRLAERRWLSILREISKGVDRLNVNIVIAYNDELVINGKKADLNGVLGGNEELCISSVFELSVLVKMFPNIQKMAIDESIYNSISYEIDGKVPPLMYIFNTAKRLTELRIVFGDSTKKKYTRKSIESAQAKREMELQRQEQILKASMYAMDKKPEKEVTIAERVERARIVASSAGSGIGKLKNKVKGSPFASAAATTAALVTFWPFILANIPIAAVFGGTWGLFSWRKDKKKP